MRVIPLFLALLLGLLLLFAVAFGSHAPTPPGVGSPLSQPVVQSFLMDWRFMRSPITHDQHCYPSLTSTQMQMMYYTDSWETMVHAGTCYSHCTYDDYSVYDCPSLPDNYRPPAPLVTWWSYRN